MGHGPDIRVLRRYWSFVEIREKLIKLINIYADIGEIAMNSSTCYLYQSSQKGEQGGIIY